MHWVSKYIGLPYEAGARGPERVDCWGLACMVYAQEFGIVLPQYPGLSLEAKPVECSDAIKEGLANSWEETSAPFEGALVAMGERVAIHHIGIFVPSEVGRILHCWETQRVVLDLVRVLRLRGLKTIKFYRHRQWPTS